MAAKMTSWLNDVTPALIVALCNEFLQGRLVEKINQPICSGVNVYDPKLFSAMRRLCATAQNAKYALARSGRADNFASSSSLSMKLIT
jgi:hypothetical protein